MKPRWNLHLLGVALLATLVCLLFFREPGFGDDFTYWSFAFDLHERGLKAWSQQSFHDLRWPVWGVSWLLQAILGPGLLSYYGVPLLYLIAGSILAFTFGRLITSSLGAAWTCAIAFLFHPLLDTVCYRPMPDLSEGVLGAAAVLTWWYLTQARSRTKAGILAFVLGTLIYLAESNRITGVFIVPVLLAGTILYARRSFGWLVMAGCVALAMYVAEAAFYHHLFGDWMHNLHANMGAKGRKGTESIALWYLPLRFLDTLWKGNPIAPAFCLFAALGIWTVWNRKTIGDSYADHVVFDAPPLGRVVSIWFAILYLEYACAPQQLWPWRPLIRDADRFLCGLAVPFSILAAVGFFTLIRDARLRRYGFVRRAAEYPVVCALVVMAFLAAVTSRELFDLGALPKLRRYLSNRAPGTKVFTHDMMRAYCFLANPSAAKNLQWSYKNHILNFKPELEAMADQADEFWYIRKLVWLNTRKELEQKNVPNQLQLASYFAEPEKKWTMTQLLAKGDTPDLIFYRRRGPDTPPPRILTPEAPELQGIVPKLPIDWKGDKRERAASATWQIPPELRGQLCRLKAEAFSDRVEAITVRFQFYRGKHEVEEYLLKPYLHPTLGTEFFAFEIPPDADHCVVGLKLTKNVGSAHFESLQLVIEPPKP